MESVLILTFDSSKPGSVSESKSSQSSSLNEPSSPLKESQPRAWNLNNLLNFGFKIGLLVATSKQHSFAFNKNNKNNTTFLLFRRVKGQ